MQNTVWSHKGVDAAVIDVSSQVRQFYKALHLHWGLSVVCATLIFCNKILLSLDSRCAGVELKP